MSGGTVPFINGSAEGPLSAGGALLLFFITGMGGHGGGVITGGDTFLAFVGQRGIDPHSLGFRPRATSCAIAG